MYDVVILELLEFFYYCFLEIVVNVGSSGCMLLYIGIMEDFNDDEIVLVNFDSFIYDLDIRDIFF